MCQNQYAHFVHLVQLSPPRKLSPAEVTYHDEAFIGAGAQGGQLLQHLPACLPPCHGGRTRHRRHLTFHDSHVKTYMRYTRASTYMHA